MSTVILDTITGKSTATTITIGSTPVVSASANSMTIRGEGSNQTSIQQGLAKTWHISNDAAGQEDSFNIGSGTDNGTGDYTYAFTNNQSGNSYAHPHTTCIINVSPYSHTRATSSMRINNFNDAGAIRNARTHGTVHGDLA